MGFMAGFGSGFSESFNRAQDRAFQKDQDIFKMKYTDYISRRDAKEKRDLEDQKNIRAAKQIASMNGQDEAWGEAYKMIDVLGADGTNKWFQENQAVITDASTSTGDSSGLADPRDALTAKAESSVDTQMAQSGMEPPAPKQGLFSKTFGPGKTDDSESMLDEATGMTKAERDKQLAPSEPEAMNGVPGKQISWKPKTKSSDIWKVNNIREASVKLAEAKMSGNVDSIKQAQIVYDALNAEEEADAVRDAKAKGEYRPVRKATIVNTDGSFSVVNKTEGGWVDENGTQIPESSAGNLVPWDQTFTETMMATNKKLEPQAQKYTERAAQFTSIKREIGQLAKIRAENPYAMTGFGTVMQAAVGLAKEVGAATNILGAETAELAKSDGEISVDQIEGVLSYEKAMEKQLADSSIVDRGVKLANAKSLYDIKSLKLAYTMLRAEGQTGNAVSAKDLDAQLKGITNPNNQSWAQAMDQSVGNIQTSLAQEANNINELSLPAQEFKNLTGVPLPSSAAPPVDIFLQQDKEGGEVYDKYMAQMAAASGNLGGNEQSVGVPSDLPVGVQEELTQRNLNWEALNPKLKELLIKKYGGQPNAPIPGGN